MLGAPPQGLTVPPRTAVIQLAAYDSDIRSKRQADRVAVPGGAGEIRWALTQLPMTLTKYDALLGAVYDDGGVRTDQTPASADIVANDMTLLPVLPVVNDAYYFLFEDKVSAFDINIGQAGAGVWTIAWEYWNGAWVACVGISDGSSGFTLPGIRRISHTIQANWAQNTVDTRTGYPIRARVSVFVSIVTRPLGTQVWMVV